MPPWIQAENISLYEQSELNVLKCFTYVPVVITFGVFLFLLVYYVAVSDQFFIITASKGLNPRAKLGQSFAVESSC